MTFLEKGKNRYLLKGKNFFDFNYTAELKGEKERKLYKLEYNVQPKNAFTLLSLFLPFCFLLFIIPLVYFSILSLSWVYLPLLLTAGVCLFSITRLKRGFLEKLSLLETYLLSYKANFITALGSLLALQAMFIIISRFSALMSLSRIIPILGLIATFLLPVSFSPLILFIFRGRPWSGARIEFFFSALILHSAIVSPLFANSLIIDGFSQLFTVGTLFFSLNSFLITLAFLLGLSLVTLYIVFVYNYCLKSEFWKMDEGNKITKKFRKNQGTTSFLPYLGFSAWMFSSLVVYVEIFYFLKFFLYAAKMPDFLPFIPDFYPKFYWGVMEVLPYGYFLGGGILLLSVIIPFYFVCKNLSHKQEHKEKEKISVKTAQHTKSYQLVREISKELNVQRPRLIILRTNRLRASSNSDGLIRLNHFIKLSIGLLKKLKREELKAVLYHEFYHLKKNTRFKNFLNLLSQATLFGRGTLTALMGFTSEEYYADEFASKRVSAKSVRNFLSKFEEERFVPEDIVQEEQRGSQEVSIFGKLLDSFVEWKDQFYSEGEKEMEEMLFGKELPTYISPSYRERIENLNRFELSKPQLC